MEKNIVALLEQNLRVIVPEFGAFIIRQKDPKMVIFNEFLRYDDGLLIDYLVKANRMEPEAARKELANYVEFANKELDAGNAFSIEGLGSLKKDQAGKIVFTETGSSEVKEVVHEGFEPVFKLDEDNAGENIAKPEKVLKSRGKKIGKAKISDETPESKEAESKTTSSDGSMEASVHNPEGQKVSEKESPAGATRPSAQEPVKASRIVSPKTVPAHAVVQTSAEKHKSVKPGRTARWLIALLILNSLIILFFLFQDNIRGLFNPRKAPVSLVSDTLLDRLTDSMMAVVSDTTDPASVKETADIASPAANSGQETIKAGMKYYIVAGCFRDEVNADELVKSLRKLGYKAEKFGKIGELYAVSFVSCSDKDEAINELKKIRENMHPEAWMTRF